ncbi:GNAT family N-acetyltransferase, partial [Klebsiella pneumoniae]|nr:GNAT family N-acetyltransferase [Klebsiella pneumoniae]
YPKLVCAIPFTPAPGSRILATDAAVRKALLAHAVELVLGADAPYSSLHVLFATEAEAHECAGAGMLLRSGVQVGLDLTDLFLEA